MRSYSIEMKTVDAFICTLEPYYCLIYVPFNKPIIMLAGTRLEGRLDPQKQDALGLIEISPKFKWSQTGNPLLQSGMFIQKLYWVPLTCTMLCT
jgi:hypothetical protein